LPLTPTIFKYRGLLKGLNPHEDSPFLRAHNLAAKEIFISNKSYFLVCYRNYELFNHLEVKLKFIPEFLLSNISLTHKTYFPGIIFRNLIKMGCRDIGDVLEYKRSPSFALTPQQSRQIKIEPSRFDESFSKIKNTVKSNVDFTELEMYDVIHESTCKPKKVTPICFSFSLNSIRKQSYLRILHPCGLGNGGDLNPLPSLCLKNAWYGERGIGVSLLIK